MRIRDGVIAAVCIVTVVTIVNLLTSNRRVASTLPQTRLEHARQELLQKPFHMRSHRLERAARLEKDESLFDTRGASEISATTAQAIANTEEQVKAVEQKSELERDESSDTLSSGVVQSESDMLPTRNSTANATAEGRNKYHVVASVGDGVYIEWQVRLCYFSYLRVKKLYPDSAMGGFTRLLHARKPDRLMDEIPTVVVDILPPKVVRGYEVINRPFAFYQWVRQYMDSIPEDYILMAESDHVFIKPPPLWASPTKAVAYPFWYIQPEQHAQLISRFNEVGAKITDMNSIGSSPVIIHREQLRRATEVWYPLSVRLKTDPEADKKLGWILDMYAWSIACAQAEGGPIQSELRAEIMLQPPFDLQMTVKGKEAFILHFTYGNDFNEQGAMTYGTRGDGFHFDKRDYVNSYPPRYVTLPSNVKAPALEFLFQRLLEASTALNWPDRPFVSNKVQSTG